MDKIQQAMSTYAYALKLRGARQEVIGGNLANADTPNYKAVDFDFPSALKNARQGNSAGTPKAATTHPAHLTMKGRGIGGTDLSLQFRRVEKMSLDNNTVDIDMERASYAENTVKYEAASTALSGVIKTMRAAITGQ
ncbi:MAG: flagellar basal body rod protein FlgB [Limnobacter sp.]|nr:flagellar basal body rod protein FlgB [Limnobacter sp.]